MTSTVHELTQQAAEHVREALAAIVTYITGAAQ